MSSSVQTSIIWPNEAVLFDALPSRLTHPQGFYQATVTDFDGNEYEFDAVANTFEEATAQIEAQAADQDIQVYNINLYLVA